MLRALAVASLSVHAAALSTMAAHLAADARSARSLDDYVFEFDLQGYCVVRGVLDADEVAAANAAIDARAHELRARDAAELRNARAGTSLAGAGSRLDLGGALGWPAPDRDVFRAVLAHPRLVPLLHRLVGEGYRLDHLPLVIASDEGACVLCASMSTATIAVCAVVGAVALLLLCLGLLCGLAHGRTAMAWGRAAALVEAAGLAAKGKQLVSFYQMATSVQSAFGVAFPLEARASPRR